MDMEHMEKERKRREMRRGSGDMMIFMRVNCERDGVKYCL